MPITPTIEKTLTAAAVMSRTVVAFTEQTSVLEATRTLIDEGISGAPVLDKDQKLVGIITEEDLLGVFYEGHRDLGRTTLGACAVLGSSLVTRRVFTVPPEMPAREVAKKLMIKKIKRVPVIDADRKVLGIVSRRDLLQAMAGGEQAGAGAGGAADAAPAEAGTGAAAGAPSASATPTAKTGKA
jgi:CBS-domain-containing membrane protein